MIRLKVREVLTASTMPGIEGKDEHFSKFAQAQFSVIAVMIYLKFIRILEIINKNIDLAKDQQMKSYCDEI